MKTLERVREDLRDIRHYYSKIEDFENKIFYVDKKVMTSDDVYLDNENEMLVTLSQKKEMLLKSKSKCMETTMP